MLVKISYRCCRRHCYLVQLSVDDVKPPERGASKAVWVWWNGERARLRDLSSHVTLTGLIFVEMLLDQRLRLA